MATPAYTFTPRLEFTRYKTDWLPEWATPIHEYDSAICECGILPVMAEYTIHSYHKQGVTDAAQSACPACLRLLMAERGEYDRRAANIAYDALTPPRRNNEQYPLCDLFANFSRYRLKYWRESGLALLPHNLKTINNRYPMVTVSHSTLLKWMLNPATWPLWETSSLRDFELRTWANTVRNAWPYSWMTAQEVAERVGYGKANIIKRAGKTLRTLPRVVAPAPAGQNGGRVYYFRSDVVEWFRFDVVPEIRTGYAPRALSYHQREEA
jgi:hypothetical protein